jgi:hypothetical protein
MFNVTAALTATLAIACGIAEAFPKGKFFIQRAKLTKQDNGTWSGPATLDAVKGKLTISDAPDPATDAFEFDAKGGVHIVHWKWVAGKRRVSGCSRERIIIRPNGILLWDGDGKITKTSAQERKYKGRYVGVYGPTKKSDLTHAQISIAEPQRSKLVFTRSQRVGDWLWSIKADGTGERRLSPKPRFAHPRGRQITQQNGNGVYSPDGRRIAFARAAPPAKQNGLKVTLNTMATDGTHVRRVVLVGYHGDLGRIAWSPDCRRLAYEQARFGRKPVRALFVVASRGGRPHRITPWRQAEINTLDWSPDGTLLLVSDLPAGKSFGGDYYTMRPDGTGRRQLTHLDPKAKNGNARWSPDGMS